MRLSPDAQFSPETQLTPIRISPFASQGGGGLATALLSVASISLASLAHAAPGGNTGGDWYAAGNACSPSPNVNSYGGKCATTAGGDASDAHVVIVDETPGVWSYGGYVLDGVSAEASRNTVVMRSGEVSAVFGARALGGAQGSVANDNGVFIEGGQAGSVYGAQSNVGAHRNYVEVTGGTMNEVSGAQAGSGSLTDNFVNIHGDEVIVSGIVSGARVNGTGSVSNNVVSIQAGSIGNTIFGGFSQRGDAIGNIVSVSGTASVNRDIYGGYASGGGNATDNRVIISGSPEMSNTILYGGYAPDGLSAGNILEIHTSNLTAGNLKDFQELHFILPADVSANATVLTLSGKQAPTREDRDPAPVATDLQGMKVGVAIQGGGNVLKDGDRITLVHNPIGLLTDSTIAEADVSGYQGVSLEYRFGLSADSNNLFATTKHGEGGGATVLEQTKAPVEGQASTLALGVQGADLAAGAGLSQALAATTGGSGVSTFGAASGGRSRYKSGSHVDVNGFSLMVGAAKRIDRQAGQVLAGAFVEGGWGRFDTHNTFSTGYVRGDGKSHYVGGGVLLRHDWTPGKHGNLYAEGSMRVGRISSDWHSQDMVGSANAAYDVSALYYGAHLGAGQVWPLNAYASVDVSAKYFWTHQKGDSATIAGDPYTFKAVDSHRARLGARLNLASARHTTSYVGAYWEREFDGQARATVYGLETPAPSLKGNTGVFEVGFNWSPDAKKALTVGVGAQGYVGMRKGVSGTARMQWIF